MFDASSTQEHAPRQPRRLGRANWPLLLGAAIVLMVTLVALVGPRLAPRDPLEENAIIRVNGKWVIPPFPAFTPGFPLGSDIFGRDLASRLLWAVRPTLTMVTAVALVRLLLGLAIGLCAGWFSGRLGRAMDAVITAALSVPVLMVALGAIAAVGIETGIWAFIVGLSINGWVETARLVREQTRLVRSQLYIEAARALGASDSHIVFRHVTRQIMPMLWMLFAFEISGTLMVAAALGFLGYYIGGDIWVLVEDSTARRVAGAPELGQMLATSWVRPDEPWAMIAVGSVVFVAVLGFNVLGRGLRKRLSLKRLPKRTVLGWLQEGISSRVTRPASAWLQVRIWQPIARRAGSGLVYGVVVALVTLSVGAVVYSRIHTAKETLGVALESAIPQGHPWSAERRDAQGTLWSEVSGPTSPDIQWVFDDPAGLAGGPAVSERGIVFIGSRAGTLYALDAAGNTLWRASLPGHVVGAPALSQDGQIFVTDSLANLSAYSETGELQWQFRPQDARAATSGPIVAPNGNAYYLIGTVVQAVSPTGQALWQTRALRDPSYSPPRLSANGEWLFVANAIIRAQDGSLQQWTLPIEVDQYIVGADGGDYLRSGNDVYQWRAAESEIQTMRSATWDYRQFTIRAEGGPTDLGVTRDELVWLLYAGNREDTRIVWLKMGGRTVGNAHIAQRETRVIGLDRDATTYACGSNPVGITECLALRPGDDRPLWQVALDRGAGVAGGALIPDRLYVALEDGYLYALGTGALTLVAGQQVETVPDGREPLDSEATALPAPETAWVFKDASGFAGGPAAGPDGSLYIGSRDGTLYALDHDGKVTWTATLPATPVGPPAVGANADIYQADNQGSLSCFTSAGEVRWRFQPADSAPSTVGPLVGPDGTVYYTIGGSVQAVSPGGEGLWRTRSRTSRNYLPLQLSATGEWLFLADDIFSTGDGRLLDLDEPVEVDQYIAGNDGRLYLRNDHTVMRWDLRASEIEIAQTAQWDYTKFIGSTSSPSTAGVTRAGVIWLAYTTWEAAMAWLDSTGQVLGTARDSVSDAELIGVLDRDGTALLCGTGSAGTSRAKVQCKAFTPGAPAPQESERQRFQEPIWQVSLEPPAQGEDLGTVAGGVLVPGRLYVATSNGFLYAIGEK